MSNVLSFLSNFMKKDPHMPEGRPYKTTSLYFDNFEFISYYEKYNGEHRRRKYRLRFYNDDHAQVFFEVKHKLGSFVTKIRRAHAHGSTLANLVEGLLRGMLDEQLPEFMYDVHRFDLKPTIWTCYDRTALVGKNNPELRVTFDQRLSGGAARAFDGEYDHLEPVHFSNWRPKTVMEIKFDRFFPFWLDTLMRELGLEQQAISKYGMIMNRCRFLAKEPAWTH